jgi:hypothetical protein
MYIQMMFASRQPIVRQQEEHNPVKYPCAGDDGGVVYCLFHYAKKILRTI